MKNKWKELREAQEADIVNDEIEEVEDEVEEVETESNAALVEEVRAAYEAKLRELADFFIGEKPDKEANELLSTMVSEVKKPEPDHDVFWDVASKLDEKKEVILAKKAVTKNAESIAKEAEHAKVEKTEAATETESVKAEKVEAVEAEEVKPAEAEAKLKQPEPTKPDVKRSEISKGYKFRHAKADQQYDAEVESILRAIGIAAISGNAVEVLKLAEELAKATGTVSFCTLKTNAGKEITLIPQGLENVSGRKILDFYSGMTSKTASGESRRFATFSREIFEELSGVSADKAEIIKVVVKDKKPSHTPPLLEDFI